MTNISFVIIALIKRWVDEILNFISSIESEYSITLVIPTISWGIFPLKLFEFLTFQIYHMIEIFNFISSTKSGDNNSLITPTIFIYFKKNQFLVIHHFINKTTKGQSPILLHDPRPKVPGSKSGN